MVMGHGVPFIVTRISAAMVYHFIDVGFTWLCMALHGFACFVTVCSLRCEECHSIEMLV